MKEVEKEKYEPPVFKRTRVTLEGNICVASDIKPEKDVSEGKHVTIQDQHDGGTFGTQGGMDFGTGWE